MRDGRAIKAQPLLRLPKIPSDNVHEFGNIYGRVGVERI